MNIVVTQENLHKALGIVGRVVGSRTSLPVLANVLLKTEKGRLKLAATDLEIGLSTWIGAKVESEGAITVPSRALSELIGANADSTISLSVKDHVLTMSSDHAKANLRGIDAEDFPVIPEDHHGESLSLSAPALLQALKQVVVAAAPDETRPVLGGVLLLWKDTTLACVATDSYRLAEKKLVLDAAVTKATEVIVPARSVGELVRGLSAVNPDVLTLSVHENQVIFAFADTVLVSRIIEGKYPDYQKIIPTTTATKAVLNADEFKAILRASSIFAREAAQTATVHIGSGSTVTISATASALGDATISASAEVEGEEMEANFNVRFLSDAVSVIPDEKIEFALSGPLQPGILRGVGSNDFSYIIMPLKA